MVLVAECADLLEVVVLRRVDAALALDGLEHDGGRLLAHHRLELLDVVVVDVVKAVRQRAEAFVVLRLARRRQRCDRTAVEAVPGRDDLGFLRVELMRVLARDLDGALIRLSARVAEERLVEAREFDELRRCVGLRLRVVEVRAVDELLRLLGDGRDERFVVMAEHVHSDAAEKVEVLLAVVVPEVRALAVVQHDLVAVEHRQVVLRILLEYIFICFLHEIASFFIEFSARPACRYPAR